MGGLRSSRSCALTGPRDFRFAPANSRYAAREFHGCHYAGLGTL